VRAHFFLQHSDPYLGSSIGLSLSFFFFFKKRHGKVVVRRGVPASWGSCTPLCHAMSTDRPPSLLSQMQSGSRAPGGVVNSVAARAHVKAVRVLETLAADKGIKLLHFLKSPVKRTAADVAYLCYQTRFLSLFDEIPELHRQFCACASICVFERDDIVFVKGGDADCYYQIADGTAVVKVGAMGGSGTKARLAASSSDIVLGVGAGLGELGLLNKV
jgi:hypothetical protein